MASAKRSEWIVERSELGPSGAVVVVVKQRSERSLEQAPVQAPRGVADRGPGGAGQVALSLQQHKTARGR